MDMLVVITVIIFVNFLAKNIVIVILALFPLSLSLTFNFFLIIDITTLPIEQTFILQALPMQVGLFFRIRDRRLTHFGQISPDSGGIADHFVIEKLSNTLSVMMIIIKSTLLHDLFILVEIVQGFVRAESYKLFFMELFQLL